MKQRVSILLHPLFLFTFIWTAILFLYSLRLSDHLLFDLDESSGTVMMIIIPFVILSLLITAYYGLVIRKPKYKPILFCHYCDNQISKKLHTLFLIWLTLSVLEVFYSRGTPLMWILLGIQRSYFDFGIPTLHGFLNSLIFALTTVQFFFYVCMKNKKYLSYLLVLIAWSLLLMHRQMLMLITIQLFIFWAMSVGVKKIFPKILMIGLLVIIIFGIVGNFRFLLAGDDLSTFYDLAQIDIDQDYMKFIPSGFLWIYIYITTPLNNLIYNIYDVVTIFNNELYASTTKLFPSFVRVMLFGGSLGEMTLQQEITGELVVPYFNVSTGFISYYLDFGGVGIIIASSIYGFIATWLWYRNTLLSNFIYAFFAQALILTIFSNSVLNLPNIFQVVWFFIIFRFIFGTKVQCLKFPGKISCGHPH